jgi:ornithine carbamoyltransferase
MTQLTHLRKDFLSVLDLEPVDLERCLDLAAQVKADRSLRADAPTAGALNGRRVALLFEKPSLRTRTTFELAIAELGAHTLVVQPEAALGRREDVADVARNLERWVDAIVIRTYSQRLLAGFAAAQRRRD